MDLTKLQLSELICKHAAKGNGLHDLMEIMIESMMVAERSEFLADNPGNKGNGYRPGSTYGHGRKLEFRIPRDRYGNFHPQILAILRDQEEECDRLAGALYTKGLTQEQVGDVFDQIYGHHYSNASISRMVECVRTQVNEWLERGLEEYYPVVFVDCVHIKIHRKRSVASEAFYVALAVTEEGTREVLGIFNMPQESATGWGEILDRMKDRGLQRVGLMVADGIKGLDTVIGQKFPGTPLQRCVTHLKRNMFAKVRHGDKAALAADLRDIFRTGQRDYTIEMAWTKWQEMCDRWGKDYRAIKLLRNNIDYKVYMTYLNYAPEIQAMIYTTNWIERLNRDFRRVTRMRTAMPNEESVLTLIGSVAMDHKAFDRALPNITVDKTLFPNRR
ncbi:MAG: IS256 family transposase [Muribaculaceae bacterium]|nr:IS256 family transposase [Muribaculaceae bacterium]MDE6754319.1 IS256 family transposase [Muribaculaceae bacterium]